MSAFSSYSSGKMQQQQANFAAGTANFNAQIAEQNARLNEMRAEEAIAQGARDEELQREKTRRVIGTQRARMASSGLVVDSGSFGQITDEAAAFGEEDAQQIRLNAARAAWGYKMDAQNDRTNAVGQRLESANLVASGRAAKAQGRAEALGTLITGGSNLYASSKGGWDRVGTKTKATS